MRDWGREEEGFSQPRVLAPNGNKKRIGKTHQGMKNNSIFERFA